jgi:TonB family protein
LREQLDMLASFSRKCSLGAIFISYRRSDSQGEAGRLFDDLVKHFGERKVFMDVVGIEAGRDFRKAIEESVAQCGVLLVVMGPEWLNAKDESGARRLDDPADFVRIETASALRRDIPVIPVLVHGAEMPRPEQLPEGVKDLAYRNSIELTHARWRSDIQLLVEALRRLAGDTSQIGTRTGPNQATASAQPRIAHQEVIGASRLENGSPAPIDAAAMRGVSRELALHIGPIADIIVRRAALHCVSIEDLYLKVSEEIESQDEREKFLRRRALISSTRQADETRATTLPKSMSGTLGSDPFLEANHVWSEPVPSATKARLSSRWKYLLFISGGFIFLIIVLFLTTRFAPQRGTSSQKEPDNNAHMAESTPVTSGALPPVTGSGMSGGGATNGVIGGSTSSTNTEVSKAANPRRVRVSQDVSAGLLITKVLPVYPSTAQQARVQGTVVLQAAISRDGTVEALRGISGHPMLIPAAIEAVKQWRYKPYVINGKPVAVVTQISVNFTLKNQ